MEVQSQDGTISKSEAYLDEIYVGTPYREISIPGDYRTSPAYFELYIISASNEKIILSSGYTGGAS